MRTRLFVGSHLYLYSLNNPETWEKLQWKNIIIGLHWVEWCALRWSQSDTFGSNLRRCMTFWKSAFSICSSCKAGYLVTPSRTPLCSSRWYRNRPRPGHHHRLGPERHLFPSSILPLHLCPRQNALMKCSGVKITLICFEMVWSKYFSGQKYLYVWIQI